jgi:hypothetical protein
MHVHVWIDLPQIDPTKFMLPKPMPPPCTLAMSPQV